MLPKRSVFSIGDLCLDILQATPEPVEFGEERALRDLNFSIGGNAANFAVIASKTGLRPRLISSIGKDFATGFLLKGLARACVLHSLIRSREKNAFSVIAVNRRGERAIQSAKNALRDMNSKKVERLLLPKLKQNDIVFFGGFYHMQGMRPGFQALLKKIKRRKAVIFFDTCFDTANKWSLSKFLPFIDFLFVNDVELKHLASGKTVGQRAEALHKKGSKVVIVKQAAKGATLFVKGFPPEHFPSVATKVVDTTGAGDAFNAGFAYAFVNGWSLNSCVKAANFVAARKIKVSGLAAPTAGALNRFLVLNKSPTLVRVSDYSEMSRIAAQMVVSLAKRKPKASFLLPAGATPEGLYRLVAKACGSGKVSFSKSSFFNLDEYAGLGPGDRDSFAYFLKHKFLDKIGTKKENVRLLDGSAKNLGEEAARHEAAIRKKGIDLCILGIAPNGHIAFNEPGCCPYSSTRVVRLKQATRKKNAAKFRGKPVPKKGITVGLRTMVDNSQKIVLLASGKSKAKAIAQSLHSKDFMRWPAVSLKRHRNFIVIADRKAASKVG